MMTFTVPTILALLTFAALASAATDFENATKCGKRFPRINQAIEIFCGKKKDGKLTNDIVVPSQYADQGVGTTSFNGNKILVAIKGNCAPAQWVPYNWCNAQFHDLCANSEHDYAWRAHGKDNCQNLGLGRGWTRRRRGAREARSIWSGKTVDTGNGLGTRWSMLGFLDQHRCRRELPV
jgi:hypothetical protein